MKADEKHRKTAQDAMKANEKHRKTARDASECDSRIKSLSSP